MGSIIYPSNKKLLEYTGMYNKFVRFDQLAFLGFVALLFGVYAMQIK